jgi:hypothetical protein
MREAKGEPNHLATEGGSNLKRWRSDVSRIGYVLVSCSVLVVLIFWSRTCALGGFHCFDGDSGHAMAAAQIGVVVGLVCSLFGGGTKRLVFAAIAFFEVVIVYSRILQH